MYRGMMRIPFSPPDVGEAELRQVAGGAGLRLDYDRAKDKEA